MNAAEVLSVSSVLSWIAGLEAVLGVWGASSFQRESIRKETDRLRDTTSLLAHVNKILRLLTEDERSPELMLEVLFGMCSLIHNREQTCLLLDKVARLDTFVPPTEAIPLMQCLDELSIKAPDLLFAFHAATKSIVLVFILRWDLLDRAKEAAQEMQYNMQTEKQFVAETFSLQAGFGAHDRGEIRASAMGV